MRELFKRLFFKGKTNIEFNTMELDRLMEKAKYAQDLLDNPIFNEIITSIEKELIAAWKNSSVADVEGRETIYMRLEALRKIETMLKGYIAESLYKQKIKEVV